MNTTHFGSEFFAGNRQRLRELFTGTAPIVLTANGSLQMAADQAYPFRQDPSFWYLTGVDEPDVVLVMDRDKEYLILPVRDERRVTFEGAIDGAAIRRVSGIDTTFDESAGWKRLGSRLEAAKHIATLPAAPAYIEHFGMYANPSRRRLISKMKRHNEQLELLDISEHLSRLRSIKQAPELAAMQAAIDVTGSALKTIARKLQRGGYGYEYEVEADLTRGFRLAGAEGHAFAPIIAGGERACTLHYELNSGQLAANELLICDVGALVEHYPADITRTYNLGAPSKRQQAVYDAVLEVQQFATEQLRPGCMLKEYEKTVRAFLGERLRELGLIKSIDSEAVDEFYPHSTSHFLGLATHDTGNYDAPLEPGMVLTVEPGIYIKAEGIGVRIEDDVLITPEGNTVLSARIPKVLA